MTHLCYGDNVTEEEEEKHVQQQPSLGSSSPIEDRAKKNQLVLYVSSNGNDNHEIQSQHPSYRPSTHCPSIGAFTVQCASCFKWRLMPSKEKYEEIREQLLEKPFYCETVCEWKQNTSCDVTADIFQDGTRLWAIDKPSIPRPPTGWQRLLRIRGEGGTRFADVYYVAPSGKKLRSNVEVQKYLSDDPQYVREGVKLSQFSFQTPKPLQDDYVRKRPARLMESSDNTNSSLATQANPVAWISADDDDDEIAMQLYGSNDKPSKKTRTSELTLFGS
ncbi:unnamed protein product [Cochlearia groenlandica]